MHHILRWLLSAVSLLIVANMIPGIQVESFGTALIAALVYGIVGATLGALLKLITFPLAFLTLGLFWLVINALMLQLASAFVPGFRVQGFLPAFLGAIALSIVQFLLRWILGA